MVTLNIALGKLENDAVRIPVLPLSSKIRKQLSVFDCSLGEEMIFSSNDQDAAANCKSIVRKIFIMNMLE